MKFISSTKEMQRVLKNNIKNYKHYKWAVAWASTAAPEFDYLKQHIDDQDKLVVGIHFYQTDPEFIQSFLGQENVRFILQPQGTFHPKIYLFENSSSDWCAMLGSSNYTSAAFTSNVEAIVVLSSKTEDRAVYEQISAAINHWFEQGECLSESDLENYRRICQRRKNLINKISDQFDEKQSEQALIRHPLLNLSWQQYVDQIVQEDLHHSTQMRLEVLEKACSYFQQYNRFISMPYELRRCIAGYGRDQFLEWGYFGSMQGAMQFKNRIKNANPDLSEAIDSIPLTGVIEQQHFSEYQRRLASAFPDGGYDIAVLTRLLAMKRPDYFISVNKQNSDGLRQGLLIQGRIKVNNYWSSVIERIMESHWWNAERPNDIMGIRIWHRRAAMLDALYYVPAAT